MPKLTDTVSNASFKLVPHLHECEANPFLYDGPEGERLVDLSGSGGANAAEPCDGCADEGP